MAYVSDSYGVGLYPYRYYSYSPKSGTYKDDSSIVISASLNFYDSSWTGYYNGLVYASIVYRDSSGNWVATDDITNIVVVSFSGTSGTFTIPLKSCPSASNPNVYTAEVTIDTTVYTDVNGNNATVTTPLADSNLWSPEFTISHTSNCEPPKHVNVSASSVAPNGEVTLSWREATAGTNNAISKYEIYRSTSSNGSYEYIGYVNTSSTSGQATVIAPSTNGSSYYYKVKTIGSVSGYDSDMSSVYATLTCSYSAPSTPQNVTIGGDTIAYAKSGNTVLLSWNAASDGTNNHVAGYVVYRDGVKYGQTGGTSMSVPVNETAGSYHTYTVYTKGAYSTSASSEAVRVYTYSDPTAPVIVNVNGSDSAYVSAGDSVTLTWSGANSGKFNSIVGYKVYQNGNEYATTTDTYLVVPAGSNTGDEYTYSVVTLGERTNSDTSKEVRVYSYSAVSAPSTVNISNLSPDAGSELTLFFSGAKAGEYNAITGYKVYEDVGATGAYNLIASISSTETSGTHKMFAVSTMATTCRYRVSTVGVYGESGMSSVYAEYTTKSYGACTPPTSVTITKNNSEAGGTARLYWSGAKDGENSKIVRYAVYRSIHSDRDYEKLLETAQTYTDVTASDTEGQIYYFKVRAIAEDQSYNSELSDAYAWIKTNVSTGIGGNSVPASAAFHAAIKNGANQRALIYFYDDGLWLTNDDIVSGGITYENDFCAEEDVTIGLTSCANISFSIFNEKHRLDHMKFGKFRASIGVVTETGSYEHRGNTTVVHDGDVISGHEEYPYVLVNRIALAEQPDFPIKSIFAFDDYIYCLGENEKFIVYKRYQSIENSGVNQYIWEQVAVMTWEELRSLVWGDEKRFIKDEMTQIDKLMLAVSERYAQRNVGIVVKSDDTIIDYLPNGKYETYTYVDLGLFYADRPEKTKTNIISIDGYDGMSKFEVSTENMQITFPITLYGLLDTVCGFVGIEHKVKSFENQGITLTEATDIFQNTTAREVLGFIAEAAGVNAKIDYDGKLMFAWWSDTDLVLDESDYSSFVPIEYTVKPIDRLQIRNSDTDIGVLVGSGTNGYVIQENPFLNFSSDAEGQAAADPIYKQISFFPEYTPGSVVWFGDWSYRPGDIFTVSYDGESYRFPVFRYKLEWAGSARINLESTGNEYREVMDAQSRETYAVGRKMLQISKTIDGVKIIASEAKTTSEGAVEKVSSLEQTVDGFNTRVTKVETGQEDLESQISQTAGEIAAKVSKGEVISAINLTPEQAKIKSGTISLEGIVTANQKFKVLLDGSIEATDGKFSGELSSGNWVFNQNGAEYTNGSQGVNMTVMSGDFVGGGSGTRAFFGSSGMDVQYGSDYNRNTYLRSGKVIVVSQNPEEMSQYGTAEFIRSESGQMTFVCGESKGDASPNTNPDTGASGNLGYDGKYWDYGFIRVLRAKTYPGSSSRAIKKDIKELPEMGDILDRLVPVSFAYKSEPDKQRYGLIYEDTKNVMPVICFDDGKGDPGIVYTDLIAPMLKEIQSLRARIKAIEERM